MADVGVLGDHVVETPVGSSGVVKDGEMLQACGDFFAAVLLTESRSVTKWMPRSPLESENGFLVAVSSYYVK